MKLPRRTNLRARKRAFFPDMELDDLDIVMIGSNIVFTGERTDRQTNERRPPTNHRPSQGATGGTL